MLHSSISKMFFFTLSLHVILKYLLMIYFNILCNLAYMYYRIGGVMVSVLAWGVVDRGFVSHSG